MSPCSLQALLLKASEILVVFRKPLADMCSTPADLRQVYVHIKEGVSADLKDAAHCDT